MIRQARERLANWWRPTLTVPAGPPDLPPASLAGILDIDELVIVTPRCVDIRVPPGCRVSVLELSNALAWIEGLPELAPGSELA